jgi:hypothetical protein
MIQELVAKHLFNLIIFIDECEFRRGVAKT